MTIELIYMSKLNIHGVPWDVNLRLKDLTEPKYLIGRLQVPHFVVRRESF